MRPDQVPIVEIWVYLSGSPLFALTLTLAAYSFGVYVYERSGKHPMANPVLIALLIVTATLVATEIPYRTYFEGAQFVHFLLGTGTVALAVPIYAGWRSLRGRLGVLMLAVFAGGLTSIATGVAVLTLLEADQSFLLAI